MKEIRNVRLGGQNDKKKQTSKHEDGRRELNIPESMSPSEGGDPLSFIFLDFFGYLNLWLLEVEGDERRRGACKSEGGEETLGMTVGEKRLGSARVRGDDATK